MSPIADKILAWYALHGRNLPWRDHPDPYVVWVSEIMLQQTRVETVLPYFERWLRRFPTLPALADASQDEVLALWEGLGYYSRARNLHRAARLVVDEYGGSLPHDLASLRKLPGIGRYTAGAIASMAFGLDEPTLDANLRRVLARLFDVAQPADAPEGQRVLWALAREHLPSGRAGDFNQAMMDLGASLCLPHNPVCLRCPLAGLCLALREGTQEQRPVLKPRSAIPHYTVTAAVVVREGRVLLAKRPARGLLGGLWEFPGGKLEQGETLEAGLQREIREETGADIRVGQAFGVFQHAYTHFRITLHAFLCELVQGEPRPIQAAEIAWVEAVDLGEYPMGKVDRLIARRLQ